MIADDDEVAILFRYARYFPIKRAKIGHVFVIVLENENADVTFGPDSPAPYLAEGLPSRGVFLPNYYGVTHLSLGNYVAMISGQGSNVETQADCQFYTDVVPGLPAIDGQVLGQVQALLVCQRLQEFDALQCRRAALAFFVMFALLS